MRISAVNPVYFRAPFLLQLMSTPDYTEQCSCDARSNVIGCALHMGDGLPKELPPRVDCVDRRRRFCVHNAGRTSTGVQRHCDNGFAGTIRFHALPGNISNVSSKDAHLC